MTNLQYLQVNCACFGITDEELIAVLTNAGLGLSATAPADTEACDLVLYNHFSIVLRQAMTNITEGGMTVSWNIEAIKAYYKLLCNKTGQPDVVFGRPTIRNRSNIW